MTLDNNSNITPITAHQNADTAPSDIGDTSIAQAAKCALDILNYKLQLIRELAVQAANANISDMERRIMQSEVNKLIVEIRQTTEIASMHSETD
jgi:flagellin-like hook-associated protein FlgL